MNGVLLEEMYGCAGGREGVDSVTIEAWIRWMRAGVPAAHTPG
ncbi:MAG: hypothetical protein ACLR8P_21885 [Clostridium fessum]